MKQQDEGGFTAEQRQEAYPPGSETHFWMQARNRILFDRIARAPRDRAVLDIGCGSGTTVDQMRRWGVDCYGCDLSPYQPMDPGLAPHVFYEQDARTLPAEFRQRVGTLMMLDVLEHLSEPTRFLADCCEAFPRVDSLLVTLPARMELWGPYDVYYGHHRRFDLASAAELCTVAGFERVETGYFFHALYPVIRATRRSGARTTPPVRWPAFHALVGRVFHLEEKLLPSRWPGSSLLVALKRVSDRG